MRHSAFGNLSGTPAEHGERMGRAMADFERNEEYVRRALSSRNCARAIGSLAKLGGAYGATLTEARHYFPKESLEYVRFDEQMEARMDQKMMAVIRACGRRK